VENLAGVFPAAWVSKAKTLARFTTLQTLVQAIMALSGFLIVRVLSKSEYAAYTIAASLQTLLNALTDCGIGWGMNAVGGPIWNDSSRLRGLIQIALRLRGYLTIVAVPMTVASAVYLLRKNGVSWSNTVTLTAIVIGTIWGTFLTTIYGTSLRLRALYTTVQKLDLLNACLRLVLIAALAFAFLNAILAVLVTAITLTIEGILLRKKTEQVLDTEPKPEESDRRSLIGLMKKQAVATLFFAYQGQITIWIISIFGSTDRVADVGALTRLAVIFAIIGSVVTGLAAPTLARCNSLQTLVRLFLFELSIYITFATALLIVSLVFPGTLLWILGGKYASLTREVPLLVGTAIIGGLITVIHSLALSRGWIWQTWIIPMITLTVQLSSAAFLPLNTVAGVLWFGIVSSLPALLIVSYMVTRGFWTSRRLGYLAPVVT
jgi:O-antigen/teichoic acid export membrane protein